MKEFVPNHLQGKLQKPHNTNYELALYKTAGWYLNKKIPTEHRKDFAVSRTSVGVFGYTPDLVTVLKQVGTVLQLALYKFYTNPKPKKKMNNKPPPSHISNKIPKYPIRTHWERRVGRP